MSHAPTPTPQTTPVPRILIVDDDREIRSLLLRFLQRESDLALFEAANAQTLEEDIARDQIDLVVLDVFLPGVNGFDALRILREKSPVPVILLTACGEVDDRLQGLELGADDYMVKPFDPRELLARIRSVLSRTQRGPLPSAHEPAVYPRWSLENFQIDLRMRQLTRPNGSISDLSERETGLMQVFLLNPRVVLSRDFLIKEVFGKADAVIERAVDVLVSRLRKQFDTEGPYLIGSVRNRGYILRATPEPAPPPPRKTSR